MLISTGEMITFSRGRAERQSLQCFQQENAGWTTPADSLKQACAGRARILSLSPVPHPTSPLRRIPAEQSLRERAKWKERVGDLKKPKDILTIGEQRILALSSPNGCVAYKTCPN